MRGVAWREDSDGSGVLIGPDDAILAHYDWRRANHPYLDRLRPLSHAGVLTNHAPHDHRWHHGLWWSWKFVNDVLFWEDHESYGGNRVGLGRSVVTDHSVTEADGTVEIRQGLAWRVDATGEDLLSEERTIRAFIDESAGRWLLDWDQTWTANVPALLEVTPWPATSWGGYAGLNYRPSRSLAADEAIVGPEHSGADGVHGSRSPWASYTGLADGAETDEPDRPASGGIALLQHPANPGYPHPVYTFSASDGFGFLATAPLMHEPMRLAPSSPLRIRTRVLVLDHRLERDDLAEAHRNYAALPEAARVS